MSVTRASLTSGNSTGNASSYTTASVTPSANKLQILSVGNTRSAGSPTTPTVTGNGLTWVQIATISDGTNRRITVFRAMGASPSAGAITIDFGGTSQNNCSWSLNELTGMDTSGTNGSGAIVQSATNTGSATTSLSITLSAFGSATNAGIAAFIVDNNLAITPDTGWTEMHEVQCSDGSDSHTNETQFIASSDTTAACSWTGNQKVAGIAIEIKELTSGNNYSTTLNDSITLTESVPKSTSAVKSDACALSEVLLKSPEKVLTDTLTLTETIVKLTSLVKSDGLTLSETTIRSVAKVLVDAVSLTEVTEKYTQRQVSDAISLTENFAAVRLLLLTLTDSLSLTEAFIRSTSKVLTDTASLTETQLKSTQRNLADAVTLTDTLLKEISKVLSDNVTVTDSLKRDLQRLLTDAMTLTSTLNIPRLLTLVDSLTLTDSIQSVKVAIIKLLGRSKITPGISGESIAENISGNSKTENIEGNSDLGD